ncbi:MAG: NUDIX domain-containing protein [Thermomicrobiales bacterium]
MRVEPPIKVRVTAVLIEDGAILLVEQQITASFTRRWSLPGGALEYSETLEACLIREMREETSLTVALDRLLYVCERIEDGRHIVHVTFAVHRVSGDLQAGREPEPEAYPIKSVRMVPITQLNAYGFDDRFRDLALAGFPDSGTYQGLVANIGL